MKVTHRSQEWMKGEPVMPSVGHVVRKKHLFKGAKLVRTQQVEREEKQPVKIDRRRVTKKNFDNPDLGWLTRHV